jgi:hypothetical protein
VNWPKPFAGQVIRYSYLWRREAETGQEEGLKDRPCAIIIVVRDAEDRPLTVVVPITHTKPRDKSAAIEIPAVTKKRLGLDDDQSWVILNESNAFRWPGPDLRPIENGNLNSIVVGVLPPSLFKAIFDKFVQLEDKNRAARVARTE